MSIAGGIFATFFIFFSFTWALLPGGLGILNFKKKHGALLYFAGKLLWLLLLLIHPIILYALWNGLLNNKEIVFSWLFIPLVLQILFFTIFARDVGT